MRLSEKTKSYRVGNGEELPEGATRSDYIRAAELIENFYDFYPRDFMRERRGSHNGGCGEMRSVFLVYEGGVPVAVMIQHCLAGHKGELRYLETEK